VRSAECGVQKVDEKVSWLNLQTHFELTVEEDWIGDRLDREGHFPSSIKNGGITMNVVAFNGGPRRDGNTVCLINHLFPS
jgi:hypothetical protein